MSTPSFEFELFHSARVFGLDGSFALGLMPSSERCLPISQRFLFVGAIRISNLFIKLVQLVFKMGDSVSIRLTLIVKYSPIRTQLKACLCKHCS
jgi:hypothetical protein